MTKSTGVGRGRKNGCKNVATIKKEEKQKQEDLKQRRLTFGTATEVILSGPSTTASSTAKMSSQTDSASMELSSTLTESANTSIGTTSSTSTSSNNNNANMRKVFISCF